MLRKLLIFTLTLCILSNLIWASKVELDSNNSNDSSQTEEVSDPNSNGAQSKHCRNACSQGQACSISVVKQKGQKPSLVTTCTAICGDGIVVGTELEEGGCDDQNDALNDGCQNCRVQPLYRCQGSPSICTYACGNQGFQPQYGQGCDDGNTVSQDGCSSTCVEEPGWICENTIGQDTKCSKCGDGVIQSEQGEECDSGEVLDSGCIQCKVQDLYSCTGETSVCEYTCGKNGLQTAFGEVCDDNNNKDGDGCSALCAKEEGYTCVGGEGEASDCYKCGDGVVDSAYGEQCDSGQTANPGCQGCLIEPLYSCSREPSVCVYTCGTNGIQDNEECDDQNTADGDGCSSTCTVEQGYGCQTVNDKSECQLLCGNGILDEGQGCDSEPWCEPNCLFAFPFKHNATITIGQDQGQTKFGIMCELFYWQSRVNQFVNKDWLQMNPSVDIQEFQDLFQINQFKTGLHSGFTYFELTLQIFTRKTVYEGETATITLKYRTPSQRFFVGDVLVSSFYSMYFYYSNCPFRLIRNLIQVV